MKKFTQPLLLDPIFVTKVWGGSGLAKHFDKNIPKDTTIGESWEAADLFDFVSKTASGPKAGKSLRDLATAGGEAGLFGNTVLPTGRMPLLFKLIDARSDLSVQVHPGDDDVDPASFERGKEEAWYILHAEKGARLVLGLKAGVSAGDFFNGVESGNPGEYLAWHDVTPGEVYYIPPGTVHAIGKGIILAEIQQSSDTTYRIYDWGRLGLDGKPRKLHIEEARKVSPADPVDAPYGPERRSSKPEMADLLVSGKHFKLFKYDLSAQQTASGELANTFALLFTVAGDAVFKTDEGGSVRLYRGQTWLLPASLGVWQLETASAWQGLWMCPSSAAL